MTAPVDAVVVGSGPNGLAAAITLAMAGRSVMVLEAEPTIGGGLRSDEIDGLVRDRCAAVMPFAVRSPFFEAAEIERHGLTWAHPEVQYSQPLGAGRAGAALRSLDETVDLLGTDGNRYRRMLEPLIDHWDELTQEVQGPPVHLPRHPLVLARYGIPGIRSAEWLQRRFRTEEAKGLLAGCAAHGVLRLDAPFTAAFATLFAASAHAAGWPVVTGGAQQLADVMARRLRDLGGEIRTDTPVSSLADLPPHRVALFDTNTRQLADIAGDELPGRYRRRLQSFRFGPGVCKVDFVLDGPVPWSDPYSARAATVHVGGTFAEVADAEAQVMAGRHPERPFALVAQQDVADPQRRDGERRLLWTYTHVPSGSTEDRSVAIADQIERFAPGFRDTVVATHVTTATGIQAYNRSFIGGDITGGAHDWRQLIARPRVFDPYRTPNRSIFVCSASSAPGGGVHGMAGYRAAQRALATALR